MITAFDLLQASTIPALVERINAKVQEGWEPFESIYACVWETAGATFYTQGLVMRDDLLCPNCNASVPGITAFHAVEASTPESIVRQINDHIQSGWQPYEDIYVVIWESSGSQHYVQGLVKRARVCMNCNHKLD